ncbi:hypothetical protein C6366_16025 [Desulfonatronum sp. SC1]|nr:hypothetical protein C6366_16025 [Desulfonatronum sp. SC1]
MPEDALMVFRAVAVPGSGFWGSQEQVIQIGDASGGIFEGLQRTQISPSFPREGGHGLIYLAKYELTKGQFAAVMGLDGLLAASGDSEDQKIPQLEGRVRQEALMNPLAFVGYHDVLAFIQRYNQWLFDPEHPQRRANMPQIDGVPGFFRLPTEEEWEFTARGGLPALEAGTFTDRLPFAQRQLNEMAWHLDNARHQTRPIGLRQPTSLGFYDLFGNVQEMTSGLFRPEIWQGKPGGVAVRGGSVSTPPGTVRSSYREELDVYAWNRDQNSMELRRSYNTGARLAIGSNVVVNTEIRNRLEREYEQYKAEARRVMPVGRTLDNLVAQAAVQLGTVEPILEQLMEQNPHLREPLQSVQVYMDRARERLDQAQRETARSLTQDAARNGVNISVYLSRLERLQQARERALQLVEMSSRYQEQLAAVDNSISELETNIQEQLRGYQDKVAQVGEYEEEYSKQALQTLAEQNPSAREQAVLELIAGHVAEFAENRRAEPEPWLTAYRERFAGFADN